MYRQSYYLEWHMFYICSVCPVVKPYTQSNRLILCIEARFGSYSTCVMAINHYRRDYLLVKYGYGAMVNTVSQ